jgi:hypothetical protein
MRVARRRRAERFYACGAPEQFRAARSTRTLDGMNWRSRILWILPFVPLSILAVHFVRQFFEVDSCLDQGGVFDYAHDSCKFDVMTLPYVAYSTQYRSLILIVLLLSAAFFVWVVIRNSAHNGSS